MDVTDRVLRPPSRNWRERAGVLADGGGEREPPAGHAAALARLHLRDPDALILAVDGDRIVGTVIAGWDGWRCHLYRLAVAPDRRRAGIGRALIARGRGPLPGPGRHPGRRDGARRQRRRPRDLAGQRLPPPGRMVPLDQAALSRAGRAAARRAPPTAGRRPGSAPRRAGSGPRGSAATISAGSTTIDMVVLQALDERGRHHRDARLGVDVVRRRGLDARPPRGARAAGPPRRPPRSPRPSPRAPAPRSPRPASRRPARPASATATIARSPSRRSETASGTSTPSAGSRRLARATTTAGTRKPTVNGTTAASGLPRWPRVSCQSRGGPRRGALGQVAEQGDRAVLAAPGDRPGLHRRQVLRLVDHHVPEARSPARAARRPRRAAPGRPALNRADFDRLAAAWPSAAPPAPSAVSIGRRPAATGRSAASTTSASGVTAGQAASRNAGDRRDLAHPAQPALARRVAGAVLRLPLQQADHPGPDPLPARPRTAGPRGGPRRRSGAAARGRSATGTSRPTP